MTRIFHIADTHIKLGRRFNECTRILDEFAEHVEDNKPDAVVHAGDLYDARTTAAERKYGRGWVQRLAHVCPVVFVRGNHDEQFEVEELRRLRAPHPIWACEEPQIITVAGVAIAALPWPTKANVIQHATDLSLEATSDEAVGHLRNILRWAQMELEATGLPTMLLMHAMVKGSRTAAGQPLVGCDFELSPDDVDIADAVALGHIHQAQSFCEGLIRYSGSPFHTDFGDDGSKSYTVWEFDADGYCKCFPVSLSAHEMIEIKARWRDGALELESDASVEGTELKLTYECAPEDATAARAAAKEWRDRVMAHGAYSVDLNPVTTVTTRARAPEVATAVTDDEKLGAHWDSKGDDVPPTLRSRLIDKFHELQVAP